MSTNNFTNSFTSTGGVHNVTASNTNNYHDSSTVISSGNATASFFKNTSTSTITYNNNSNANPPTIDQRLDVGSTQPTERAVTHRGRDPPEVVGGGSKVVEERDASLTVEQSRQNVPCPQKPKMKRDFFPS
uniref:Uncharacterized protein n=1 Tax=Amphora coffeiformis TaxID=265554 RepID=A0A7S3PDR7_9STRA|mmetsp:Transcript_6635/g.13192  ORF Transcript_6635/g.13192 Transcript_6635/m.13192 type:complete len:131 (+) Transcript_6635:53-445(+)|eukprot:scaffold3347_cov167-Amphora_coffeaeformis.AAC.1